MSLTNSLDKFLHKFNILTKFVSVQIVVQALGMVSGLLIIRTLDKSEYAYFTIANAMQSTMDILADIGISIGVTSIGGKVWQDRYRFGQLINTAMYLRRYMAAISVTIVTPLLMWMLISNGSSTTYALIITLAILVELMFYLITRVLSVVPRLQSQIKQIQNLDLIAAGSRLTFILIGYFTFFNAFVAVSCSTIASAIQSFFLQKLVNNSIDTKAPINQDDKSKIWNIVISQAPSSIFYCAQGQITIWLITIFGKTNNIAEVGALGRLGVIFTIISSVMTSIVVPSYAKYQSANLLQKRYWQILVFFCVMTLTFVGLSAAFPQQILWILGNKYAHLQKELIWIVASTTLSSLTGAIWSLNVARAWVSDTWLIIPTTITTQILLLMVLDVSTVTGVIIFGLFSSLPAFLVNIYMSYKGLKATKSEL